MIINVFSTNIKLNGYYGKWDTVCELEYKGNIAFILQDKERVRIITDLSGRVLIEDGKNFDDFKNYIDNIEFYCGGNLRNR